MALAVTALGLIAKHNIETKRPISKSETEKFGGMIEVNYFY